VDVAVTCSSGTYIRALARDLGAALGVGGHLTYLRRTRVGGYGLDRARTLDQLADAFEVTPIAEAASAAFPRLDLTEEQARTLSHGGRLTEVGSAGPAGNVGPAGGVGSPGDVGSPGHAGSLGHVAEGAPIAAFAPDGTLVALVTGEKGQARPIAVFAQD
jgi:tRNA pseudouridine55 synthase